MIWAQPRRKRFPSELGGEQILGSINTSSHRSGSAASKPRREVVVFQEPRSPRENPGQQWSCDLQSSGHETGYNIFERPFHPEVAEITVTVPIPVEALLKDRHLEAHGKRPYREACDGAASLR